MQKNLRSVDFIWLLLMAITVVNGFIAETADGSFLITVVIAISVAFKGRMVVMRFMELHNAHHFIRTMMGTYFYVIPLLFVLVAAFPESIAQLTSLN